MVIGTLQRAVTSPEKKILLAIIGADDCLYGRIAQVVERFSDKEKVAGAIPATPTRMMGRVVTDNSDMLTAWEG